VARVETAMKIKTQDLTGPALDWAVALADGNDEGWLRRQMGNPNPETRAIGHYSTNWSEGGPIIDREIGNLYKDHLEDKYAHNKAGTAVGKGPTYLVAAMRCYVASKLGGEVDVPDELCA
jgi:hypothetical protein